ncbi:hypothetical protein PR048_001773 [Dryococelus australis]|uniref:D-isomer specific 2-hydroxyacid dehydrogenase NAD-binding domain-containing protein n=1 Tax=Dryococelus australis TaxID=614101 RepID=A0ABQ9IIG5_9NEOP|nr:hypothetical protein PR048_001773 [Dryococelus australis]
MCGQGLQDSTVGIVGFGRIGQEVAIRLQPFKVKNFLYSGRSEKPGAKELGALLVPLDELLRQSDFVIVCCALTPETRGMFNDDLFSIMKRNAIFINVSRGAVVDQPALLRALQEGKILAAGLDVMTPEPLPPSHPLLALPNCGEHSSLTCRSFSRTDYSLEGEQLLHSLLFDGLRREANKRHMCMCLWEMLA